MSLERDLDRNLEEVFENEKINNELKETLNNAEVTLRLYLKDDNTVGYEKIIEKVDDAKKNEVKDSSKNSNKEKTNDVNEEKSNYKNITDVALDKLKVDTKKSMVGKGVRVVLRVGEELLDSTLREFFKKKYKWNYSVYNDAKSAALATRNKDYQTAIKKATDSILYSFNKIPVSTKKIIKNTKNTAIDESFSMSQNS